MVEPAPRTGFLAANPTTSVAVNTADAVPGWVLTPRITDVAAEVPTGEEMIPTCAVPVKADEDTKMPVEAAGAPPIPT